MYPEYFHFEPVEILWAHYLLHPKYLYSTVDLPVSLFPDEYGTRILIIESPSLAIHETVKARRRLDLPGNNHPIFYRHECIGIQGILEYL